MMWLTLFLAISDSLAGAPEPAMCSSFLQKPEAVMGAIDEALLQRVADEQGYALGTAVVVTADNLRQIARESKLPVPPPGASVDASTWTGTTPDDGFVVTLSLETLETAPPTSDPVCAYTKGLEERFVAGAGAELVGVAVTRIGRRWTFDATASAAFLDEVIEAAMAASADPTPAPSPR